MNQHLGALGHERRYPRATAASLQAIGINVRKVKKEQVTRG